MSKAVGLTPFRARGNKPTPPNTSPDNQKGGDIYKESDDKDVDVANAE